MPKPTERGHIGLKLLVVCAAVMLGVCLQWVGAAITRTALGTGNASKSSTCTISSVTLANGDTLYVGGTSSANAFTSATWGATTLTNIDKQSVSGSVFGGDAYLPNATAGTNTVTVNFANKGSVACSATGLTGVTATPLDQHTSNNGSSASPDSGKTSTTTKANEMLIGFVGMTTTSGVGGTWSNSFADGQSNSTNQSIDEGFLYVTATQTADAAKTGATNAAWATFVATFIDASQPAGSNVDSHLLTLGFNWILWPQWFVHPTW